MKHAEIDRLMTALRGDDPRATRDAGARLVAIGPESIAPLVQALGGPSVEARKAASFLLGRFGRDQADRVIPPLVEVLGDEEPKVRKNAAVSLGRLRPARGAASGSSPLAASLAAALANESIEWVRSSIILALGAVGGEEAAQALEGLVADSDEEREALTKARDRLRPVDTGAQWKLDAARTEPSHADADALYVRVPIGLEGVAKSEAEDAGFTIADFEWGYLRLSGVRQPQDVLDRLRTVYDVRLLLDEGPPLGPDHTVGAELADRLGRCKKLLAWRDRIATSSDALRYRLSVDRRRLPREAFRDVLRHVRARLEPAGLLDSPSAYAVGIDCEADHDRSRLFLVLSFLRDPRFAYRLRDVGAALDPVIAAGIARWNQVSGARVILDPTCGSGTLLIERARLESRSKGVGIDVSPTAVAAARTNVAAAGLEDRLAVLRRDASDERAWRPVEEVLANLPFGIRSSRHDRDLEGLYARLVGHLDQNLDSAGRAVLYTANRHLVQSALRTHGRGLRIDDSLEIGAGGLTITAFGLEPRPG